MIRKKIYGGALFAVTLATVVSAYPAYATHDLGADEILYQTILQRDDIRPLVEAIVGAQPDELDMFHPIVHALQTMAEIGDAANYPPLVQVPHILSIGGKKDGCAPLEVVMIIGSGMGLEVGNPLNLPMFGTASPEPPSTTLPVSGNLAGGRTGVTIQLDTGHFGFISNPNLGRSFVDSLAGGGTPTIDNGGPLASDAVFGSCPMRHDPLP